MTEKTREERYARLVGDGWIGVDMDGTLAVYDHLMPLLEFGPPIPMMVDRVRGWIAKGHEVRIVTARMPAPGSFNVCAVDLKRYYEEDIQRSVSAWTQQHIGRALQATCIKDFRMIELWDDRAVQVIANTGQTLSEAHAAELEALRGKSYGQN